MINKTWFFLGFFFVGSCCAEVTNIACIVKTSYSIVKKKKCSSVDPLEIEKENLKNVIYDSPRILIATTSQSETDAIAVIAKPPFPPVSRMGSGITIQNEIFMQGYELVLGLEPIKKSEFEEITKDVYVWAKGQNITDVYNLENDPDFSQDYAAFYMLNEIYSMTTEVNDPRMHDLMNRKYTEWEKTLIFKRVSK